VANVTLLQEGQPDAALSLARGERLLDGLLRHAVPLEHECGGVLACATCRVVVRQGLETLTPADEDEEDMLERAGAGAPGARLACQVIVGSGDLTVEVPRVRAAQIAVPSVATGSPVSLTERAARHFANQLAGRADAAAVRLRVEPAGCSGFKYRVAHADELAHDDAVFESRGIRIAVDAASLPLVQGTTVDVAQAGLSRRLRFDNPNAKQTCGCGESFGA
jgi:iron-sulfur cluster assembly protein